MEAKIISHNETFERIGSFSSLAYTREFLCFQEKHYGLKNIFVEISKDTEPVCILPINLKGKEGFCVYKDYAHIFFHNQQADSFDWQLAVRAAKEKIDASSFELQIVGIYKEVSAVGFASSPLSVFTITLDGGKDESELFSRFDKKTRNEIRKSQKCGFEIRMIGADMLDDIYSLYIENMKRHGTPPKPKKYFEDLFSCFGEKCQNLAAFYDGKIVGLNIFQTNQSYLRLIFNLSKVEFWHMCVNNLLYYETVKWAMTNNVTMIDFGPSLKSDRSHNKFKLGFGAEERPIFYLTDAGITYRVQKWLKQKWYNFRLRQ